MRVKPNSIPWNAERWVAFGQRERRWKPYPIEGRILQRLDEAKATGRRLRLLVAPRTMVAVRSVWRARYGELPLPVQEPQH